MLLSCCNAHKSLQTSNLLGSSINFRHHTITFCLSISDSVFNSVPSTFIS